MNDIHYLRDYWGPAAHWNCPGCIWSASGGWKAGPGGWNFFQSHRKERSEIQEYQTLLLSGSPTSQKTTKIQSRLLHCGEFTTGGFDEDMTYFPRVLGADSDAKLCSDEGVVDEVGHILEWLPVVLTGRQMAAAKMKCKSNSNRIILLLTGEITRLTFDRV